jgi:hypothetical protein
LTNDQPYIRAPRIVDPPANGNDSHGIAADSLEQLDDMAGEVVSAKVLWLVYGSLALMIIVGVVILYLLGPKP